jgi:hypothetical protein
MVCPQRLQHGFGDMSGAPQITAATRRARFFRTARPWRKKLAAALHLRVERRLNGVHLMSWSRRLAQAQGPIEAAPQQGSETLRLHWHHGFQILATPHQRGDFVGFLQPVHPQAQPVLAAVLPRTEIAATTDPDSVDGPSA